jgi:hypothetical protein
MKRKYEYMVRFPASGQEDSCYNKQNEKDGAENKFKDHALENMGMSLRSMVRLRYQDSEKPAKKEG